MRKKAMNQADKPKRVLWFIPSKTADDFCTLGTPFQCLPISVGAAVVLTGKCIIRVVVEWPIISIISPKTIPKLASTPKSPGVAGVGTESAIALNT